MDYVNLEAIADILNGYNFKSSNYVDDGIRVIRITNVQQGYLEDKVPVFYEYSKDLDRYLLKENDLLMSLTGNVGRVGLLDQTLLPAGLNQRVACIRSVNDNFSIKFLYYFFNNELFRNKAISNSNGVAQLNLSTEWLKKVKIPVFDDSKQQEIVELFDRITYLIDENKKQLSNLDNIVKSQFIEMFGDCKNHDLIGNVLNICRGASPRPISNFITSDDDGVNWIKIGDVDENSLYITSTDEKITREGALKSRIVKPGDFILSNSMSFGRPYILGINGCVHDGWLILSDYENTFNPLYLYYAIRDDEIQYQFNGKANGATVRNLNSELVRNTSIKIPTIALQNKFADFVQQIDKSKFIVQKQIKLLEELLEKKMQEYFGD